jgi:hypothetical protein
MLQITPEQVEFKELAIGDPCFHGNIFYRKTADRMGVIESSVHAEVIGNEKQFTGNALVNIVLEK